MSSFLPSVLNSVPPYLAYKNLVANFYIHGDVVTVFIAATRASRQNNTLLGFFLGGFRQHYAASCYFFLFNGFNHNAVAQRFEGKFHLILLKKGLCICTHFSTPTGRVLKCNRMILFFMTQVKRGGETLNKILTNYGDGVAVMSNITSGVTVGIEEAVFPSDEQIASPAETMPAMSGSLP